MLRSLVGSEMCIRDSGGDQIRFANSIPIETRIEYCLEKIPVGEVIGPLAVSYTHLTLPPIYPV